MYQKKKKKMYEYLDNHPFCNNATFKNILLTVQSTQSYNSTLKQHAGLPKKKKKTAYKRHNPDVSSFDQLIRLFD